MFGGPTSARGRKNTIALTRIPRQHILYKRSSRGIDFDFEANDPTYTDAIGVPRGVPTRYKLADQVAAGFKTIPIWSAIFPVLPNKNVD